MVHRFDMAINENNQQWTLLFKCFFNFQVSREASGHSTLSLKKFHSFLQTLQIKSEASTTEGKLQHIMCNQLKQTSHSILLSLESNLQIEQM